MIPFELDFSPKINVLIGENAQGKTNLMESIYVLSMAKSHRTSNDKELIRWEADYGKIKGDIQRKYGHLPLELIFSKKGKKAKVNHLEQTKTKQLYWSVKCRDVCTGGFVFSKRKSSS